MSRNDEMLIALWKADAVLKMALRIGGPRGMGSSLGEPGGGRGELPDIAVARAVELVNAVGAIKDPLVRRVIVLAMETMNAEPVHTERSIAGKLNLTPTRVHRLKTRGLDEVRDHLARQRGVRVAA